MSLYYVIYTSYLSLFSLSLSQTTSTGFGSNGGGGGGWGGDVGGEVTQKFESMTFSAKGGRGGFGRNSNDLSLSPHAHSPISFGYFLHVIFFILYVHATFVNFFCAHTWYLALFYLRSYMCIYYYYGIIINCFIRWW